MLVISPAVIRKTYHRVHVGDIHPLRICPRIERDAKGSVQSGGENLHLLGLTRFGDSTEHLNVAGGGFSQEDIAVRSNADDARIVQPGRIKLHLETLRSFRPDIRRPRYNFWPGGGRLRGIGRGKIRHFDMADGAGLFETVIRERRFGRRCSRLFRARGLSHGSICFCPAGADLFRDLT